MIVSFHLIAFLVYEYFTPKWQRNVRDITCEVDVEHAPVFGLLVQGFFAHHFPTAGAFFFPNRRGR